jgi:7-carboxy-7-deazaguanine synthase (Cx14CxxC type)
MSYFAKEIFYTLQGEGANAGRPAVFCRFTGCNLWSGREIDRPSAICNFCDTDFVGTDGIGGGIFQEAGDLARAIDSYWPVASTGHSRKLVVCTGGEPLLQVDSALVIALHELSFEIAIETNGTKMPPEGIDWICVSPKARADWNLRYGNELKIVYPQEDLDPGQLETLNFQYLFLQPMDGPDLKANIETTLQYCLANPKWRLSLQLHKIVGIR